MEKSFEDKIKEFKSKVKGKKIVLVSPGGDRVNYSEDGPQTYYKMGNDNSTFYYETIS